MSTKKRTDLKQQFEQGAMPAQQDFEDLIDSMLNMLDEGFHKTEQEGVKVAQLGDGQLFSFYRSIDVGAPLWSLGLGQDSDSLNFVDGGKAALLTLAQRPVGGPAVGVRQPQPRHELDVAGTVAAHARVGRAGEFAVPADGNWYNISEPMTGCQAWEVVAGVGARDSEGRYAIMHAFALNAFKANGEITYHQSHFGRKCSRIELRWADVSPDKPFDYQLQMRVGCSYGEDVYIHYHMTQLWQDTLMLDSGQAPTRPVRAAAVKGKPWG